jgi:D-alanyl-D-alanine carboxypeptidase/D-alanyl-D-alanine-endopeptidase (penicillin-binding protein 4)
LRHIFSRKGIIINNSKLISEINLTDQLSIASLQGDRHLEQNIQLKEDGKFDQPKEERELLTIKSPSLESLVQIVNQNSNNLFAEVLFKYITNDENDEGDITPLEVILTELGLDKNSYKLVDGSGLSRHNLITPRALTDILTLMRSTEYNQIYRQSLAVAGIKGTLKKRFENTLIETNFRGKTGTLSGISALSGYLEMPDYQPLVLSIIVNNSPEKASTLRKVIDEIVILLTHIKEC